MFKRIDGEFPVVLAEVDEPFGEPDNVLEMNVIIQNAVAHQQISFESFGKIDW